MRKLFYRVTAARVWRSVAGFTWEAHLLIEGQGKVIKGTVPSMDVFPAALETAVAAAYQAVTGEPLPNPDGQLPLL